MYWSNWSLNIHPPGIPWPVDCAFCPGRGKLDVALEGWEIWTGFMSCSGVILLWVFSVFARFDGFTTLLVNNSFKRVFKRSLKVSPQHISLWKVWTVFDWRRNLTLRRGISELIGGAFEWLFLPQGEGIWTSQSSKVQIPGGLPRGRMLKLRFDWYLTTYFSEIIKQS